MSLPLFSHLCDPTLQVERDDDLEQALKMCVPPSVRHLYMYRNRSLKTCESFPEHLLAPFCALRTFAAWGNRSISRFPDFVLACRELTELDLNRCCIRKIPKAINQLAALETLNLSENPIAVLPVLEFTKLKRLYLGNTTMGYELGRNTNGLDRCRKYLDELNAHFGRRERCVNAIIAFMCVQHLKLGGRLQQVHRDTWLRISECIFSTRYDDCWDDGVV